MADSSRSMSLSSPPRIESSEKDSSSKSTLPRESASESAATFLLEARLVGASSFLRFVGGAAELDLTEVVVGAGGPHETYYCLREASPEEVIPFSLKTPGSAAFSVIFEFKLSLSSVRIFRVLDTGRGRFVPT